MPNGNEKIKFDIVAGAEGAGEIDRLAHSLEQLDQAVDPAAAARAQELAAELQRLGAQQAGVERFQQLSAAVEKARADLAAAEQAVAAMRAEIDAAGTPTTAQAGRLEKLGAAATAAAGDLRTQTAALDASRGRLAALGIDADDAAAAEHRLDAATAEVRTELAQLGQSLQGVRAGELVDELRQLGQQQQAIAAFHDLQTAVDKAKSGLTAAESALEAYRARMDGIEAPTAAQVATQQRLGFAVDDARAKFAAQAAELDAARAGLQRMGVETGNLAAAEERLRTAAQGTLTQVRELGQQQAALGTSAREAQARATALAENLKALQTGFRDAGGTADAMGQHLDTAFRTLGVRSVQQVTAEIDRLKAALYSVKAADAFGPDVQRASAAMQQRVQALEAELGRVPPAAQRAGAGMAQVGQSTTGAAAAMEAATLRAVSLGAALLGIGSASQVASGVVRTAAEFETLRLRLEQLLGSTSAATAAFDQIKQLAISTPFEVKDLTEAFVRLTSFGLKPTQTQLLALADTAAVAGGGTEQLQRVTLALGQAWAKTKLQGDEILQLTEAGVPVWDLLAKVTGKNVVELQSLSRAGALGRDVIIKLFEAIGEKNAGASARLMATFSGAISNAKDALSEFFDMIGRSGALEYLTQRLQDALNEFDRMKNTGELERKAKAIADAFVSFAQAAEQVFDVVRRLSTVLELLAAKWAAEKALAFARALVSVEAAAVGAAGAVTAAGVAAEATATRTTAAAAGVGLFGRALSLVKGLSLAGLVIGVVELTAEFFRAKKAADDGDEAVRKMLAGPAPAQQTAKLALRDVNAELADFKKNLPKLESDLAGLTGEGLATAAKSTIENLRAVHAEGSEVSKALLTISERAAKSLGIELPSQAAKASEAFKATKAEVDLLLSQLPNLGLSAKDAATVASQALGKMIEAATKQAELDLVIARIKQLGQAGVLTGDQVAVGLRAGVDKARELKEKLEDATPGIQGLGEAARKAGVDVGLLTDGITKSGRDSIQTLNDLIDQIVKSGVSAEKASPVLADALDKRIEAAQTTQELDKLRQALERIINTGKMTGPAVANGLQEIKTKTEELSPATKQANADAKLLGITLEATGKAGVASIEQQVMAYERLKAGGKASAADIQQAFINLTKKQLEANGGVITDTMRVEAAMRGVGITMDAAGNISVQALNNVSTAAGGTAGAIGQITTGAVAAADAVNKLGRGISDLTTTQAQFSNMTPNQQRQFLQGMGGGYGLSSIDYRTWWNKQMQSASVLTSNKYDSQGWALDQSGNRLTVAGQFTPPDDSGDWVFDYAAYQKERGYAVTTDEQAKKYWKKTAAAAANDKAAQAAGLQNAFGGTAGTALAASNSAAAAGGASYTTNVTIGSKNYAVRTVDKSSADALMSALEAAYAAAGGG